MDTKNPPAGSRGRRASVSIVADAESLTPKRLKLQANQAAKVRLSALLFARRTGVSDD